MRLAVAIFAALLAAPVAAQTDGPVSPSAASQPVQPGNTVSGITVTPLPSKQCSPRDKDCIALVIADLRAHYPEQLKKFCYQTEMNVAAQNLQANINGWCDRSAANRHGGPEACNHSVPPVIKQACAPDPAAPDHPQK